MSMITPNAAPIVAAGGLALLAATGQAPAMAAPAPPVINTTSTTVSYDCGNQPQISIVGSTSVITLTGSCGEIDVNGANNTVQLATVASINANGTNNKITWQAGPNGTAPQISNPGINNTVSQAGDANPPTPAATPASPGANVNPGAITVGPGGVTIGGPGGAQIQAPGSP